MSLCVSVSHRSRIPWCDGMPAIAHPYRRAAAPPPPPLWPCAAADDVPEAGVGGRVAFLGLLLRFGSMRRTWPFNRSLLEVPVRANRSSARRRNDRMCSHMSGGGASSTSSLEYAAAFRARPPPSSSLVLLAAGRQGVGKAGVEGRRLGRQVERGGPHRGRVDVPVHRLAHKHDEQHKFARRRAHHDCASQLHRPERGWFVRASPYQLHCANI